MKTENKGKLLHLVAKSLGEHEWFERVEKTWSESTRQKDDSWETAILVLQNNKYCFIDDVELKSYLT